MEEIKNLEECMILIGQKLEKLRQNMDMTQTDITDEVGISRKTVSSIENGNNFSVENLVKLLITYNRIDPFLNMLSLPYDFDIKQYKKELKEFNNKFKNEWWFNQKFGEK
jgi:DNA-binding XRE family transcriptional regulator